MSRFRRYNQQCTNIEAVINYDKAKADNFEGWELHHVLETHTADWICRPHSERLSMNDLIAMDMYYNRPPTEFIFLTKAEHNRLHWKGKKRVFSAEHCQHISEGQIGKKLSEEHKQKIGNWSRGRHWYNNGETNIFAYECPDGYVPGKLLYKKGDK